MTQLALHPQSKIIRLQLRQNMVLQNLGVAQWNEFEPLLEITDYAKGETLELRAHMPWSSISSSTAS